jgi:hypothetical protein
MLSAYQIRNYPFFDSLSEAELARAAKVITRHAFANGACVYYSGGPGIG